ncbi:unnamed protein product [Brassica oleracea]
MLRRRFWRRSIPRTTMTVIVNKPKAPTSVFKPIPIFLRGLLWVSSMTSSSSPPASSVSIKCSSMISSWPTSEVSESDESLSSSR